MTIKLEISARVATVTINRPEVRNSINPETHEALAALWPQLERDDAVAVVVLTGAGEKAFCTGADIGKFLPYISGLAESERDPGHFCGLTREPVVSKPIIAALNGATLGGGLELALACDLRIAASTATFGLPEVKIGAIAGAGGVVRLARLIPEAVAMDLLLTGKSIDAARAYEVGLVSEVVPLEALRDRAQSVAEQIARNAPLAVRLTRSVVRRGADMGLFAALELERAAFRRVLLTKDLYRGIEAFKAKNVPDFLGN